MIILSKAVAVVVLAAATVFASGSAARALDEPRVPENVGQYFASALVPRLVDLFGAKAGLKVAFDSTDKVGGIRRVLSWTSAYLSGIKTDEPTQLTNTWIAPVSAADGTVAGLATVWINPASDLPELADFSLGASLARALASAPSGTLVIRDGSHSAWFAIDGRTLTPLVTGSSGVSAATTPTDYQRKFSLVPAATEQSAPNQGLLIAGLVLGGVVALLAVFVLLPNRRRRARANADLVVEVALTAKVAAEVAAEVAPVVAPVAKVAQPASAPARPVVPKATVPRATVPKATVPKSGPIKSIAVKPTAVKPTAAKSTAAKPSAAKSTAVKRPASESAISTPAAVKPIPAKRAAAKPSTTAPPTPPGERN